MNNLFAAIYELGGLLYLGENGDFSAALYDNGLYQVIGLLSVAILTIFFVGFYYWPIDHPRWNNKKAWFFYFFILCALFSIGIILFLYTKFDALELVFNFSDYLTFAICNLVFCFILSAIIIPILFKRWSTNSSNIPFHFKFLSIHF